MIVRTREGRPIKLAGNADHPVNQGGLTASDVASIMDLYYRISSSQSSAHQRREETQRLQQNDRSLKSKQTWERGLCSSDCPDHQSCYQIHCSRFHGAVPRWKTTHFSSGSNSSPDPQKVPRLPDGKQVIPDYRFDKADYILSIDGDFLGTMINLLTSLLCLRKGASFAADKKQ